jgi:hypothetical protein
MQDVEMNPQEYDSPIIPRDKDVYTTVGKKLFKEIHAFFQIVKIETDLDFLGLENLKYMKRNEYLKYDSLSVMSNIMEKDIYDTDTEVSFCDVTLKLSDKLLIQKRTFTKFAEILGNIGGFMQIVFSFLKIICYFSTHILYEISLVNNLFEFNVDKKVIYFNNKDRIFKKNITLNPKLYIPLRSYHKISKNNNLRNEEKMNNTDELLNIREKKIQPILNQNSKIETIEFKLKPHFSSNFKEFEKNKNLIKYKLNYENNNNNGKNDKSDINLFNIMNYTEDNKDYKGTKKYSLIKRLKINGLCIYFCFFIVRRKNNVQNILLDEGIRLIVEQLDLVNIFKKLYSEDIVKERMNNNVIITMSNNCKNKLTKFYKDIKK